MGAFLGAIIIVVVLGPRLDEVIKALKRIADALETISGNKEKNKDYYQPPGHT